MAANPTGGVYMPVYDYVCNDCHKTFERVLTLHEHDSEQMRCPHCGSQNIEQEAAAFYAVTSKKSA
jgi:putative FmdB family regulatory protein